MGNIEVLGIQELTFGEQRALQGGGIAWDVGYALGLFAGAIMAGLYGWNDFAEDFAEGFMEGFSGG